MQEDVFPKLQVAKIMIMKLPCKANILDVIILLNHKLWVNQIVLMEHPGVLRNNIILSTYTSLTTASSFKNNNIILYTYTSLTTANSTHQPWIRAVKPNNKCLTIPFIILYNLIDIQATTMAKLLKIINDVARRKSSRTSK